MKKIFSIVIAVLMALFSPVPEADIPAETAETGIPTEIVTEHENEKEEISPILLNHHTLQTSTRFSVSEDGMARVYLDYTGYRNVTTGAVIDITIEGADGTVVHTDTVVVKGEYYQNTFTYQLIDAGAYRCTVLYTVSGVGAEDDIIPFEDTQIYRPKESDEEQSFLPTPMLPVTYETAVSLSANAAKKYIGGSGEYFLIHGEEGYIVSDDFLGERYLSGDFCGLYRYQPHANGGTLICEDADCLHIDCAAVQMTGSIFDIGGILYRLEEGEIRILCDGQWKTVWKSDGEAVLVGNTSGYPLYAVGWRNYLVYGNDIYITANGKDGRAHVLCYHTRENVMTDLTQDTGIFIHYEFIYDGMLYGYNENRSEWIAYDQDMQKRAAVSDAVKTVFEKDFRVQFTLDTCFFGVLYDENGESLGIMCFDIETEESVWLSGETLGATVLSVIHADEEKIFFLDAENKGKILCVDRNGENVRTVYENEDMNICAYPMLVLDGEVLVYAQKIGMIGGRQRNYADGWYRGDWDENGNLTALTWLEAMQ